MVNQIPDDANDNVIFNNTANSTCNFGAMQNALGTITVTGDFTSTIKLGANTAFQACSILGACTINLNGKSINFGNVGVNPGVVGVANSIRPTISGGGSIEVSNNEKLELVNVTLGSSVNVNAGGKLYFGYITYGSDTTSAFKVNGGTVETNSQNATFISNSDQGNYYQPIVVIDGNLNFVTNTTVVSYIDCYSTVLVKGTQANPNVMLTITGKDDTTDAALVVRITGVFNLAAGSTISGNVFIRGGMNLFDPPPGSSATVCTIAQGGFGLWGTVAQSAILNLNNYTLNVSNGNTYFDYSAVTTNVAYGGANDPVRMGNITVSGGVTFVNTNTLTQGTTGTPKAFSLPLITATDGIEGDFDMYVLSDGVTGTKVGGTITLSRQDPPPGGEEPPPPPPPP